MYKAPKMKKTTIKVNKTYTGETIEQKINRIVNNREPITDGVPIIYTDRSEGILPAYNIRTDRMEIALEARDHVTKSHLAKRENRLGAKAKENMDKEKKNETKKDGGAEPAPGTDNK